MFSVSWNWRFSVSGQLLSTIAGERSGHPIFQRHFTHQFSGWSSPKKRENTWFLPQQVRFSVWEESWDNPKYVEKSKSGVAQQKENTRRWLREWDINHTGKRKSEKEKCLHRKKSLWRPQALTWGASFTATSHCTQFYKTGYDTFVPACSGDKASNNSDASKNYKSGGPSAIATASREWLLFNLFFFF